MAERGKRMKLCCTCKWHADNDVCTNGDSDNVADFTDPDDYCEQWEGNYKEGADEQDDDI